MYDADDYDYLLCCENYIENGKFFFVSSGNMMDVYYSWMGVSNPRGILPYLDFREFTTIREHSLMYHLKKSSGVVFSASEYIWQEFNCGVDVTKRTETVRPDRPRVWWSDGAVQVDSPAEILEIEIRNALGQLVLRAGPSPGRVSLPWPDAPPGLLVVQVRTRQGTSVQKTTTTSR